MPITAYKALTIISSMNLKMATDNNNGSWILDNVGTFHFDVNNEDEVKEHYLNIFPKRKNETGERKIIKGKLEQDRAYFWCVSDRKTGKPCIENRFSGKAIKEAILACVEIFEVDESIFNPVPDVVISFGDKKNDFFYLYRIEDDESIYLKWADEEEEDEDEDEKD